MPIVVQPHQPRSDTPRHPLVVVPIMAVIALMAIVAVGGRSSLGADATPAARPCVTVATPVAAATAVVEECAPLGLGTPVALADLAITLTAGSGKAGPIDLTIELRDAAGDPIDDAIVTIFTQHLGMNHGVSTDVAERIGPGRYLAPNVSMGMGGDWQADIEIARPDHPPVVATFIVRLDGPTH